MRLLPLFHTQILSSSDPISSTIPSQTKRRSTRLSKPPSYLETYRCSLLQNVPTPFSSTRQNSPHPIAIFVSYSSLSPSYKHFVSVSFHF